MRYLSKRNCYFVTRIFFLFLWRSFFFSMNWNGCLLLDNCILMYFFQTAQFHTHLKNSLILSYMENSFLDRFINIILKFCTYIYAWKSKYLYSQVANFTTSGRDRNYQGKSMRYQITYIIWIIFNAIKADSIENVTFIRNNHGKISLNLYIILLS